MISCNMIWKAGNGLITRAGLTCCWRGGELNRYLAQGVPSLSLASSLGCVQIAKF